MLVAIPYYGAAEYVDKAVSSVLDQTHRDFVCLVVGDGETPPLSIHDDRLIVHSFPENRGAPFTQQAMLLGSPFQFYAPFGSDDWADPDHLEGLVHAPNVCVGSVWWHDTPEASPRRVGKVFEIGCWSTDDLRSIGGYGAQERMGQDSLMLHIMARTIGYATADKPTYHRVVRPGALGTSRETRRNSPARIALRRRNRDVARQCQAMGWEIDNIRRYREGLIPQPLRHELMDRAGEIRRLLS